jgi:hypothetical protein
VPIDNFRVKGDKITILNDNKTVRVGEMLRYEYDYEKLFNLSAIISKGILVRNDYYIFEKPILSGITQGNHSISAGFLVPKSEFMLGKAKFVLKIEYSMFGGLRTLYDEAESEEFTIIK